MRKGFIALIIIVAALFFVWLFVVLTGGEDVSVPPGQLIFQGVDATTDDSIKFRILTDEDPITVYVTSKLLFDNQQYIQDQTYSLQAHSSETIQYRISTNGTWGFMVINDNLINTVSFKFQFLYPYMGLHMCYTIIPVVILMIIAIVIAVVMAIANRNRPAQSYPSQYPYVPPSPMPSAPIVPPTVPPYTIPPQPMHPPPIPPPTMPPPYMPPPPFPQSPPSVLQPIDPVNIILCPHCKKEFDSRMPACPTCGAKTEWIQKRYRIICPICKEKFNVSLDACPNCGADTEWIIDKIEQKS